MKGPLGSKDCPIAAERAWMAQEPAEAWEAYAQPVMTVKCVQDDTVCVCECVRTATKTCGGQQQDCFESRANRVEAGSTEPTKFTF